MAEGGPGRGRGGRGATIAKLLAMQDNRPGPPPQQNKPEPEVCPVNVETETAPVMKPRGRGFLMQQLQQQVLELETHAVEVTSTSDAPSTPSVVPVPVGRGRLFQSILENKQATQGPGEVETSSVKSSPPRQSVGAAGETVDPRQSVSAAEESPDVKDLRSQMTRSLRIQPSVPPVYFRGTGGQEVNLTANYIPLLLKEGRGIYEYEIRFSPTVDDRSSCERMIFQQHREIFQGKRRTFDGVTLYMPQKLSDKDCNLTSVHPHTNETHQVSVIFKRERSMTECTHMYNVLFNTIQKELKYVKLKDKEFFLQHKASIIPQHKLEVWPGYVTTVEAFEGGIMLMCNVSSKVLRTQTVLDLIRDLLSSSGVSRDWRTTLQKIMIGQTVMTRNPYKTYRIDDIDFEKNPESTFTRQDGSSMTYVEYHRRKDIHIKDMKQPLLVHRPKANKQQKQQLELLSLVPELCYLTGLTDEMRADYKVMKDVGMYTRLNPNQRQQALNHFLDSIRENENCVKLLDEWGLKVPDKTISLKGRIIDPEPINFGRGYQERGSSQADWSRAATSKQMLEIVHLKRWMVIHTMRDDQNAGNFIDMMGKVCPQLGVNCDYPDRQKIRDDRTETYLTTVKNNIGPETQLVVCIFPTARDDRYSALKKLCCVDKPIPSQVINSRTISRPDKLRSIVQKIALQINCKLGGALWSLNIPFKRAMICGIDSYHDTQSRAQSVAGFVASMNPAMTRWHSQVFFASADREMVDGLRIALSTALDKYYEVNLVHPDTIVVFRDGVGDGQIKVVQEHEIPVLEKAFKSVSPDYKPGLAFIICQKRINTRIFMPTRANDFENPPPGTVLDHMITRRYFQDFFLVSQFVRQGTVTPTHYVVIHNDTRLDAEKIQKLTYKMCHLYYNWPGTVRVPAPCQYAHKLAYLVGNSIHKKPAHILCDKLFFL